MAGRELTLGEKWRLDEAAYENGAKVYTKAPQCKNCCHFVQGDAFHCGKFVQERKPREVMFAWKECPAFVCKSPIKTEGLSNRKQERLYGGFLGFIIGDMLGVPVEFSSRQEREADPVKELRAYGTYHQPFGAWSDDSSLMLCLLDALLYENYEEVLRENMVGYLEQAKFTPFGEVFDIGNSTRASILRMSQGISPVKCGGTSEADNGNGSLMRIFPLAFLEEKGSRKEWLDMIQRISCFTHAHMRSRLACIYYTLFAAKIYEGYSKEQAYAEIGKEILEMKEFSSEHFCYRRILNSNIWKLNRDQIPSTGYVVDTLEAVLWSFIRTDSYEEAVLTAVNLGGDTDTIAALTGGLAGIYYGVERIPDNWIQNIAQKEQIWDMIQKFNFI